MLRLSYSANHFTCISSHTSLCTSDVDGSLDLIDKELEHPNNFSKTFQALDIENQDLNIGLFPKVIYTLDSYTLSWLSTVPSPPRALCYLHRQ